MDRRVFLGLPLAIGKLGFGADDSVAIHDGRWWRSLDQTQQLFWTVGFSNGVHQAYQFALQMIAQGDKTGLLKDMLTLFSSGSTFGEMREQVSILYEDPANRAIEVVDIFNVALRRLRGDDQKDIDWQLGFQRASANKRE